MRKFEIIMATILFTVGIYSNNHNEVAMLSDSTGRHHHMFYQTEPATHKELNPEMVSPVVDHSFCYLEFTAFPTRIEDNTFGMALGYRVSEGENSGSDYSFHVMRNASKEIIIAGKANHLFYILEKSNLFAPYVGFGLLFGVAPEQEKLTKLEHQYADRSKKELEYKLLMDGEVCIGIEYKVNSNTRQFFELTYYAHTEILQLSIGLGF